MGRPSEAGGLLAAEEGRRPAVTGGPDGSLPWTPHPPPPDGADAAVRYYPPSRTGDGPGVPGDEHNGDIDVGEDGNSHNDNNNDDDDDDNNNQDDGVASYTYIAAVRIHAGPEFVYHGADEDDDLGPPPGYTAPGTRDTDTISLPPAYAEAAPDDGPPSSQAMTGAPVSAAALAIVEPTTLVISGHFIYRDDNDTATPEGQAGLPLYAMNRGIASLSHSDTGVDFERIDYTIRPADRPSASPDDEDDNNNNNNNNNKVRITSHAKSIFSLRHIDERSVNLYARTLKGYRNRIEGQGEPVANIPQFFSQAASRRCLGSFGLRKVRHRVAHHHQQQSPGQQNQPQLSHRRRMSDVGANSHNEPTNSSSTTTTTTSSGAGSHVPTLATRLNPRSATEQGYAVVRLARRRAQDNVPHFAVGDGKGSGGFARPIFEACRIVQQQQDARSSLGAKLRGKARANSATTTETTRTPTSASACSAAAATTAIATEVGETDTDLTGGWEWLDEVGTCVAREDQVLRSPMPISHGQGVLPEYLILPQSSSAPASSSSSSSPPQQQQQQQQQKHCHRLVTLTSLPREEFDVLVSSWCLRVWWANADVLSSSGRDSGDSGPLSGMRRKFKAAEDFGLGPSLNARWGYI